MTTQPSSRNRTVLVVDDDHRSLQSVSMLLEASGYMVVTCGNAQEAIEKFQTTNIDVVLSDINMPEFSGIELAGKIHEMNSEVPVILMTAYAEVDIAVDAIHKGAFDFITKPYKPEYIIGSVGKAVRFREMILFEKNYKQKLEEEVSLDASHLKKAEQEMQKLSLAVQGTSDWVLITDRTGSIEYVNRAAEEISGFGKEEIIGQKPSIFRSGKHDAAFFKELWDTILSGRTYRTIMTNRRKNGELFEIYHTITPLKDGKGGITHFVAISKDLTKSDSLRTGLITLLITTV